MEHSGVEDGLWTVGGQDISEARRALGTMWGANRPLSAIELARALGLSVKNGDDHVRNMENGRARVTGPIKLLLRLYLDGTRPPDNVEVFNGNPGDEDTRPRFGSMASMIGVAPLDPDRKLTTSDLASHVGLSEAAIGQMRVRRTGPPCEKEGRRFLYRGADVNAWVESRQRAERATL
jgi:predicted DNA-binding transcriptional regulator AlpA